MKKSIIETKIYQATMKISSLLWIGCLWMFCSLPLVTAGASTTALYRLLFNLRRDGRCSAPDFYQEFRSNFKSGSLIWLVQVLLLGLIVGMFFLSYSITQEAVKIALIGIALVALLVWLVFGIYGFALNSYFENTLGNTLKNAVFMAGENRKTTMIGIILTMLPLMVFFVSWYIFLMTLVFWIVFYPGLAAYLITGQLEPVFRKLANPSGEELPEETEE